MSASKREHEKEFPPEQAETAEPGRGDGDRQGTGHEQLRDLETEVRSLGEQLEAARAERDAHKEKWLRAEAERDNYRKRVQREMDELRQYQALPLVRDLLPALDNLQRALAAASTAGATELMQGVEMIVKQFEDVLARHGAKPIEAVGQTFDPHLHEAIQYVASAEIPAMSVVDEAERGYVLHDRVVRPSKVVVSSGPPPASSEEE